MIWLKISQDKEPWIVSLKQILKETKRTIGGLAKDIVKAIKAKNRIE